jgi:hypothetical protein
MELFNKLNLFYFILSFSIGIFFVYIFEPKPHILYKYPTPNDNTIYNDLANNCYKYSSTKVKCNNPLKIPLQFL